MNLRSVAILDPSADDPDRGEPRPGRRRWVVVLLTIVCALLAAMWVYAFVFATEQGIYRVDDEAWRSRARQICEDADIERQQLADTDEGFIADPTPEQMLEHAGIVDRATDIVERMIDDLVAVPVASDRDRELIASFEGFYRTIIADRRAYTARLRAGQLEPYRESTVDGGPVTNVVTDFTSGNDIKDCVPPGELGGGM